MPKQEYEPQYLADLKLAYELFDGFYAKDRKGLLKQQFLKDDEEEEAFRALGRLLRNGKPLDSLLRIFLAGHFDGALTEYNTKAGAEIVGKGDFRPKRRLKFVRSRGAVSEDQRRLQIGVKAWEYREEHKVSTTKAVEKTAEQLNLSIDTVWDGWNEAKRRGLVLD